MRPVLIFYFILLALDALASPAEEPRDATIPLLETAQELLGAKANWVANRIDSFFATERADDEFGRSRIRVRSQFLIREQQESDLETQYRINLKIPHLEKKFNFEQFQTKKEKVKDLNLEEVQLKQNQVRPGWIFNSDIGVGASIPPKLITRARVRRNFEAGRFIHHFSEQLIYITDESGLVDDTTIDSDFVFSSDVIFRFLNSKRWEVNKKNFVTNHGPTLIHQFSENDAFNYGLTMQSLINESVWYVSNYRFAVNYRRNLYRQWVYLDIVPGIDFPKELAFRRNPFINFQLELLFGT